MMSLLFTNKTSFFELLFAEPLPLGLLREFNSSCFMFENYIVSQIILVFSPHEKCLEIGFAIYTKKIARLTSTSKSLTIVLSIYYLNNKINFAIIYHIYIISNSINKNESKKFNTLILQKTI